MAVHLNKEHIRTCCFCLFCVLLLTSQIAVIETLEKASLKWSTEYQNVTITQRDWEMSTDEMHLNAGDEHKLMAVNKLTFCKYLSTIDD